MFLCKTHGKKCKENSLDVACRWRHHAVVNVLLEKSDWSDPELRKAMKNTSPGIESMLKDKIKGTKEEGCHCCII